MNYVKLYSHTLTTQQIIEELSAGAEEEMEPLQERLEDLESENQELKREIEELKRGNDSSQV